MTIIEEIQETTSRLRNLPNPVTEIKMHPDDIEALRRKFGASKVNGPVNSWSGIKIIPDEFAERLPRPQQTEP